jgi:hypothetical protein
MGTKMAPSYANIFMGKLEKLIIQSAPTGSVSIQKGDVISGCFMGEFYSGHSWHGQRND